jgi:SHS2 domain-containing protein
MHEFFDHTADIGIRARADTLPQVFASAAEGLFSLLVANLDGVRTVQSETIQLEAERIDDLLHDWLAELLYYFDTKRVAFSQFDVRIAGTSLSATVAGEPVDPARHELDMDVKAITYHGLRVERNGDGWVAEVIVDL